MKSRVLLAAALLLALGSAPAAGAPQREDHQLDVTVEDGVLYPGCSGHPFNYSFEASDMGTAYSRLQASVQDRRGNSVFAGYAEYPPTTGSYDLELCSTDLDGKFTLLVSLTYLDTEGNTQGFSADPIVFTMAQSKTRTTLSGSPTHPAIGSRVKLKAVTKAQSPGGYAPFAGDVKLLELRNGKWVSVATRLAKADGKVAFSVTYKGGTHKYRASTAGTEEWDASSSKPVTLS